MTRYVVLKKNGTDAWSNIGGFDASSDTGAIRKAAEGKNLDGEFVAIPVRSFQVRRATSETKTIITFPKVPA